MELKPGYKHTEVGMIPEDWDVKRLREISPSQSVGLVINPSSYFEANGEVPMLVGSCISENKINSEKASRISSKNSERLAACRLKAGDLVTVRVGFPGTTAVVPTELDGCNCASMMIIRSHKSFDSYWLAQLLNSPIGRAQIENVEYGTAQKQFNISDAINFVFPVPPPAEQGRIAEAARSFDDYIESLEQKIGKKREIKQAAMQELLTGKRRLPGFEVEWETVAISQIAEKITGFWGRTEPGNEAIHSTNVIRAGDISEDGRLIGAACRYLSHHEISAAGCRSGDTVMTASGNGLGKSWTCSQDGVYSASNFVRIIRPLRGKADGHFIGYALKSRRSRSKLIEHTATSAYPNLKPSFFNDSWLPLPPEPEQKAISRALQDIDIEILELEAKKLKASQLKQGMMQQLLTGKIRLK